jgi:hypothetical protein
MRSILLRVFAGLVILVAAVLGGCARKPPQVTEVEGTILLGNAPLPFAQVEFMPELAHFGAEMNSSGTTDEKGHYRLTCAYKQQAGAVVGKHRVLIREAPTPEEVRRNRDREQPGGQGSSAALKNRPIPEQYGDLARTPLSADVSAGKKTYDFNLSR